MAIRTLRIEGDSILRKISRDVDEINQKIQIIIDDMKETMYINDGVGLAAPQIGILKRIVVVDVSQAEDNGKDDSIPDGPLVLINPQIIYSEGSQVGLEGCLSVPDTSGKVDRPSKIRVKAKNENFEDVEFEAEGFFARAICHEVDHLNGILYIDKLEYENDEEI